MIGHLGSRPFLKSLYFHVRIAAALLKNFGFNNQNAFGNNYQIFFGNFGNFYQNFGNIYQIFFGVTSRYQNVFGTIVFTKIILVLKPFF